MKEPIIIVLDDDPTGTQTVHDVPVYTDWEEDTWKEIFQGKVPVSFILTNSRSFSEEKTAWVHRAIARSIQKAAMESQREYMLISRSDSTLRGHYPLETEVLRQHLGRRVDGELIIPFFPEGGRFTRDNIHYVVDGGTWIPAGESEFAKDRTFGYHSSHLGEWIEEKTGGRYIKEQCIYLEESDDYDKILEKLLKAEGFVKIIVNATNYSFLDLVCDAVREAVRVGKFYLYRTAAAFPKSMAGISDGGVLSRESMVEKTSAGGIVLIGSHVRKTTRQFEALKGSSLNAEYIEFNQHLVLSGGLDGEVNRTFLKAQEAVRAGKTAVIYTRRERVDLPEGNGEAQLRISVEISEAVTSIITRLKERPAFIIAKGGITSSDVAVKALGIKKAIVLGQAAPGIPVWRCGGETKFPGMPYIIFPGNVGSDMTLRDVVAELTQKCP